MFYFNDNKKSQFGELMRKIKFDKNIRYCSSNAHHKREQGRHDDIISMIFMLIELLTSTLPWKGYPRKQTAKIKDCISDEELFHNCPASFEIIFNHLRELSYYDTPSYEIYKDLMRRDLKDIDSEM